MTSVLTKEGNQICEECLQNSDKKSSFYLKINLLRYVCMYFLFVLLFLGQSETNLMLRDRKTETSELKLLSNFKLKTNISALKSIIQFSRSS